MRCSTSLTQSRAHCLTWSVLRSEADGSDLGLGATGTHGFVHEAGENHRLEPEVRVATVGCLDLAATVFPVAFGCRCAHVSGDTLGCGEIVHFSSKEF